jgi:hypothetical protein
MDVKTIKCSSCRTKKDEKEFMKNNKTLKCCYKCRSKYNKSNIKKSNIYEGKTKCYRCQCWRYPDEFLSTNQDRYLKTCIKCRNLSKKFTFNKKQNELKKELNILKINF